MKKFALALVSCAIVFLGACSSMPINRLTAANPTSRAEIVIYRESSFNAGGVSLAVGFDGQAFASLGNSDYTEMLVSSGAHAFFVRARTADPTTLNLEVRSGERRCLKTVADPVNLAKALIPVTLMATGYHFILAEVPCEGIGDLAKFSKVAVEYQGQ